MKKFKLSDIPTKVKAMSCQRRAILIACVIIIILASPLDLLSATLKAAAAIVDFVRKRIEKFLRWCMSNSETK